MCSKTSTGKSTPDFSAQIEKLKQALKNADAVLIGAGTGLSTSAGFTYSGARFETYFSDFAAKYDFSDMYTSGFYPFPTREEFWAYWSRYIFINRYQDAPKPVYNDLLKLVQKKTYFVITTNVDHCFQKAGFDKQRLFLHTGRLRPVPVLRTVPSGNMEQRNDHPRNGAPAESHAHPRRAPSHLPALRQSHNAEPALR